MNAPKNARDIRVAMQHEKVHARAHGTRCIV